MATKPYGKENLKKLRNIVKLGQAAQLSFDKGGTTRVDMLTASAMLKVYKALGQAGKEKFVRMLETRSGFAKLVDFTWKHVK
jgi:hypothetical protein